MSSVTVVGSANVDQIFSVQRIPAPGETVLSTGFATARGGKGQNQAVAAARAGAATTFVAAIGNDGFGTLTRDGLIDDSIDVSRVRTIDGATGTALIAVDGTGENTIIVEAGANRLLTTLEPDDAACISASSVLAMQLEIPLETVIAAAEAGRAAGTTVILNAAPIRDLPASLLAALDILIVNEHEAAHLTAGAPASDLVALVPTVIVTLGADGAVMYRRDADEVRVAAPSVSAVDATGAGDTFCGAFAAVLAEGMPLGDALRLAVVAASLSVETHGAVPSIPRRPAINARLNSP